MLQNRLAKLREERANGEHGFTLIELLVVVVIIGILIAIAIPLYLNYRKGASDKSAQSDLRSAITTLEQCNSDNSVYPTAVDSAGAITATPPCTQTINSSSGTSFTYFPDKSGSSPDGYIMASTNSNGSGKTYCYDSTVGGSVTTTNTPVTAYRPAC